MKEFLIVLKNNVTSVVCWSTLIVISTLQMILYIYDNLTIRY